MGRVFLDQVAQSSQAGNTNPIHKHHTSCHVAGKRWVGGMKCVQAKKKHLVDKIKPGGWVWETWAADLLGLLGSPPGRLGVGIHVGPQMILELW